MTKKIPNQITVPLEFKVACTLNRITIQEALQIFINYCTLYNALNSRYNQYFDEANETIFRYLDTKRPGTKVIIRDEDEVQQRILAIVEEAVDCGYDFILGQKRCTKHVNRLFTLLGRKFYPGSRTLYLDEETPLQLTKDFCVICELYGCQPSEYLEYYMSMISMADAEVRKDMMLKNHNCSMYFFMNTTLIFMEDHHERLTITREVADFLQEAEEFRLYLYTIRNFQQRKAMLQKFYQDYYQSINSKQFNYAN